MYFVQSAWLSASEDYRAESKQRINCGELLEGGLPSLLLVTYRNRCVRKVRTEAFMPMTNDCAYADSHPPGPFYWMSSGNLAFTYLRHILFLAEAGMPPIGVGSIDAGQQQGSGDRCRTYLPRETTHARQG
jgi:hypothetical protein